MTNEERAKQWYQSQPAQEHADFLKSLAELLREVRLDEAEWWWNHPLDDGEEESKRIAALREGRGK